MKSLKFLAIATMVFSFNQAYSEETKSEKATDKIHDTKRDMKSKKHHVEEKLCTDSDAECLAKKAEHKATEASDATKDKTRELKNKVDGK